MRETIPKITKKEIALIKKAKNGDTKAFDLLYYKYINFVKKLIYKYIKDEDESSFLANEVFIKVHQKLSTFESYDSFGGWLRIIANRIAIDYLRKPENKYFIFSSNKDRAPLKEQLISTEDNLINYMTYEKIIKAFDNLSTSARMVCLMHYVNNLTVKEISDKLRIPEGTVKSHLSRSRNKIKSLFNNKN